MLKFVRNFLYDFKEYVVLIILLIIMGAKMIQYVGLKKHSKTEQRHNGQK